MSHYLQMIIRVFILPSSAHIRGGNPAVALMIELPGLAPHLTPSPAWSALAFLLWPMAKSLHLPSRHRESLGMHKCHRDSNQGQSLPHNGCLTRLQALSEGHAFFLTRWQWCLLPTLALPNMSVSQDVGENAQHLRKPVPHQTKEDRDLSMAAEGPTSQQSPMDYL